MRLPFQLPESVSSFSDYFKLTADTGSVASALGYGFASGPLVLPRASGALPWADTLQQNFVQFQSLLRSSSEIARREFWIAPVVQAVALHTQVTVYSEYPLDVSARLHGTLDYLLEAKHNVLVIEAKQGDLERGFRQLMARLVALDAVVPPEADVLYGAVTLGSVWQWGVLERAAKQVRQDSNLFRVPQDLPDLVSVLVGILTPQPLASTVPA